MKRNAVKFSVFLALASLTALAGCASEPDAKYKASLERNPAPCPNIIVLQDAARMIDFRGEEKLENIAYTAEITGVNSSCRYFSNEPIDADVRVNMSLGRGPKAENNETEITYFVAVTRTNRDLIAKQEFTVPVKFRGNSTTVDISEYVADVVIPRANDTISGINFEIIVGLSLSQKQVIYNRSGKSLKFPELQQ